MKTIMFFPSAHTLQSCKAVLLAELVFVSVLSYFHVIVLEVISVSLFPSVGFV